MKRLLCIGLILVLVLSMSTGVSIVEPVISNPENKPLTLAYDAHSSIVITSDGDFASQASAESWAGSGTSVDPYVIEEFTIDITGTCISVSDVTVPFIIRNCELISTLDGISLTNVGNCTVYNVTITDQNSQGVYVYNSFCTVYNCTFTDIFLGVTLEESTGCNITDNTFVNCGIEITGAAILYWNHDIQSNTVNGKPLGYFWNNKDSVKDVSLYGQVILANCTNVTIQLGNFSHLADAILLGYSSDCLVFNNTVHNTTRYGIYSQYSSSTYTNNTIYGNAWGIYLRYSVQSIIANNTVYENTVGLRSSFAEYSKVRNNDIFDNVYGVHFFASEYCNFTNNQFINDGVFFSGGTDIEHLQYLSGNTVNGRPIGYFWGLRDDSIDLSLYGQVMAANCSGTTFFGASIANTDIGFYMTHSSDNTIQHTVVNESLFGVFTGVSPNVVIRNCSVYNCLYDSFTSTFSDNTNVIDCQGIGNRYGCYFTSSSNSSILQSNFTDNTLDGISLSNSHGSRIISNNASDNTNYGIYFSNSENVTISSNIIFSNSGGGISQWFCKNSTITNNEVRDSGIDNIHLSSAGNVNSTVSHNRVYCSTGGGIKVESANCTIYNNTITGNLVSGSGGIVLGIEAHNCLVEENNVTGCNWWGLYVNGANNTIISKNEFHANQYEGIYLREAENTRIMNNNIKGNAYDGVRLLDSNDSLIMNNIIVENDQRGLVLEGGSSDNTIFGNVIAWNVLGTAMDDGSNNYWDNGVDRGNQWSDYGGTGTYGISGTAGSVDNYPAVIAPYIVAIDDFERNSPVIRLTWDAIGVDPDTYTVFVEGSQWEQGEWDGWSVSSTVSFPSYGNYNITLFLNDTNGYSTSSTIHYNFISGYVVHSPISITSDAGFASMATSESWAGDGSMGNPYIIEGYNITSDGRCIGISNVNVHFIIRNCHLTSSGNRQIYGHGTIRGAFYTVGRTGNDIYNDGIDLTNVLNVTIFNNTIIGNLNDAIHAYNSLCQITNNTIKNSDVGIHLISSPGCKLLNNTFLNCGVRLSGTTIADWEHEIEDNLVNGKDLRYYFNENHLDVNGSSLGQVIIANCDNISITEGIFSNVTVGFLVGFSTNCEFSNNTFSHNSVFGVDISFSNNTVLGNNSFLDNYYGLYFQYTHDCIVENNTFTNCGVGMHSTYPLSPDPIFDYQHQFNDNTVNDKPLGYFWDVENLILDADDYGQVIIANGHNIIVQDGEISNTSEAIVVGYSDNCTFNNLEIHSNVLGVWIYQSPNSTIQDGTISDNLGYGGIAMEYSYSSRIIGNEIYGNTLGLAITGMGGCIFSNNIIRNNSFSAFRISGSAAGNIFANNLVYGNGFETQIIGTLDVTVFLGSGTYFTIFNNTVFENLGRGIETGWGHHLNFTQNEVFNNGHRGIIVYNDHSSVIYNNTCYNNGLSGIVVINADHCWIEMNNATNNGQHGIFAVGDNCTVIDNVIGGNTDAGLLIQNSVTSIVQGNSINENVRYGITIINCPEIQIINNTFRENMDSSINLSYSNSSIISENLLRDNLAGMTIADSSFTTISSNEIHGNYGGAGVLIQRSIDVVLSHNKIFDNNRGISLEKSNSCILTYNMVYENTLEGIQLLPDTQDNLAYGNIIAWNPAGNAFDEGTGNVWFSVDSIGNQWSDWSGIGDYEIQGNANSTDQYPSLVAPTIESLSPFDTDQSLIEVTWTAMGVHSDTYVVYLNDYESVSGEWDGWSITLVISLEDIRENNLTLFVNDTDGNSASTYVWVTYTGATTTTTPTDTTSTTTTTTTSPPPEEPLDPMLVVVIAGGGVLFLLLAILIVSRKRREPKPPKPEAVEPPPPKPPPAEPTPEEAEEPEEIPEVVQVLRGCAPVGGKFEYKVKIKNDTPYVIHSVTVTIVDYPRDCMELSEESTKRLEKIEPGGFRSPQFSFIPTKDCVEGRILSSVSYVDYENNLETVEVEPIVIRSVCDLLEPLESTMEEFELMLGDMEVTREEREMEWNPEVLFRKAEKLLPNRNFHILEAESSVDEGLFRGVIRGLAEGKYTRKKVAVRIVITGKDDGESSRIVIEGLGEDAAMLPTTIEEITSGIDAWTCLNCGGALEPEQITKILDRQPVECQYCKRTVTIHLYRK